MVLCTWSYGNVWLQNILDWKYYRRSRLTALHGTNLNVRVTSEATCFNPLLNLANTKACNINFGLFKTKIMITIISSHQRSRRSVYGRILTEVVSTDWIQWGLYTLMRSTFSIWQDAYYNYGKSKINLIHFM